jgi:hypothetical protein
MARPTWTRCRWPAHCRSARRRWHRVKPARARSRRGIQPPLLAEPHDEGNAPYKDAIEPVYPELYIIPFFRGGTFVKYAWMLWREINKRDSEWTLGKFKKPQKWARQIEERNRTPQKITDTIKYGTRHRAQNKVNQGNTATRYEWNRNYVVQDDQTREILQVGRPDFDRNAVQWWRW